MELSDPFEDFARLVRQPDDLIRLDEAALALARTEYPDLDVPAQIARLDRLAERAACSPERPPLKNIEALNSLLFEQEGFRGNEGEYDDPRNSYLSDVLDRKLGIPITLSLVYIEVARRKGLPVVGVGFPGHFLVKYLAGREEIILDPYNRGAILTRQDCEDRLKAHFGESSEWKADYLLACTPRGFLTRMLSNLKGSYFRRNNYGRVLAMIRLALAVNPDSRQEIHDRGMIYFLLRRYAEAKADLKRYLDSAPPGDPQATEVKQILHRIRGLMN